MRHPSNINSHSFRGVTDPREHNFDCALSQRYVHGVRVVTLGCNSRKDRATSTRDVQFLLVSLDLSVKWR